MGEQEPVVYKNYLVRVLGFGLVALALNLAGTLVPGWLIMHRSVNKGDATCGAAYNMMENWMNSDKSYESDTHDYGRHTDTDMPTSTVGGTGAYLDDLTEGFAEEWTDILEDWNELLEDEIKTVKPWMELFAKARVKVDVSVNYGLWYSSFCLNSPGNAYGRGPATSDYGRSDFNNNSSIVDNNSSYSDYYQDKWFYNYWNDNGDEKCTSVSTDVALTMSYLFAADMNEFETDRDEPRLQPFSKRNLGDASLKEHRVESATSMAVLVAGLLLCLVAFKKNTSKHKWAALLCIFAMLVSAILMITPLLRVGRLNYRNYGHSNKVKVHAPYSILISGSGVACAIISMVCACCGLCTKMNMSNDLHEQKDDPETNIDNKDDNSKEDKRVTAAGKSILVVSEEMAKRISGSYNIEYEPETKPK